MAGLIPCSSSALSFLFFFLQTPTGSSSPFLSHAPSLVLFTLQLIFSPFRRLYTFQPQGMKVVARCYKAGLTDAQRAAFLLAAPFMPAEVTLSTRCQKTEDSRCHSRWSLKHATAKDSPCRGKILPPVSSRNAQPVLFKGCMKKVSCKI